MPSQSPKRSRNRKKARLIMSAKRKSRRIKTNSGLAKAIAANALKRFELHPAKLDVQECDKPEVKPISYFRRFLPQILAATAKNLLLYDLGTVAGFQTVLIAGVLNAKTGLTFNGDEASWFASLLFIGQILGSLFSATLLEPLGRRTSLVLLNFPLFIGWLILCSEYSVTVYYAASIILGIALGSVEAPAVTYIGEISEPAIRGVLTSYSELTVSFGILTVYSMGVFLQWQTVAYICTAIPVISAIFISQIPESPTWLLANGRKEDAEKALCWLRGWVKPGLIKEEFSQLIAYSDKITRTETKCTAINNVYENKVDLKVEKAEEKKPEQRETAVKADDFTDTSSDESPDLYKHRFYSIDLGHRKSVVRDTCMNNLENGCRQTNRKNDVSTQTVGISNGHDEASKYNINGNESYRKKLVNCVHDLKRSNMLHPLLLVSGLFFFFAAAGYVAVRPFANHVFKELGFALEPSKAVAVSIMALCLGKITLMITVHLLGKRCLVMLSCLGCGGTCIGLAVYAMQVDNTTGLSWTPVVLYLVHVYCYGLGLGAVPWMYLSEVFPFRGRATAAGLAATMCYLFGFLVTKTFITIKTLLTLSSCFFIYGVISLLGCVYIYCLLPETEGKTLQDIEQNHFNKSKS